MTARQARRDESRRGRVWRGEAGKAGKEWLGVAGRGGAWPGRVWRGRHGKQKARTSSHGNELLVRTYQEEG